MLLTKKKKTIFPQVVIYHIVVAAEKLCKTLKLPAIK